jgi:succinate dehydrogenase / fumarate reductase iron-sulfur subunit
MIINGKVRQSCTALIDQISPNGEPITLQPMTKFPLVRDLQVDRSRMFNDLKKVKAWVQLDGSHELGPGPRQSQENQEEAYPLSRCMTCGCCMEACPQVNDASPFIGPAAISQVRLFNLHPSGKMHAAERLEALMGEGGVADCGKAQNCVEVCPKEIPLVDSIAQVSRQTTKHMLFGWLLK